MKPIVLVFAFAFPILSACSVFFHTWRTDFGSEARADEASRAGEARTGAEEARRGAEARNEEGPRSASVVKLLSWADRGKDPCEVDIEGTAPPASFRMHYVEDGRDPVTIDSDVNAMFADGWELVNRSPRGYGLERSGDFRELRFDVVEELRCKCRAEGFGSFERNHLLHIEIDWRRGQAPQLSARIDDGEPLKPRAAMHGRLVTYEYRFEQPFPADHEGVCSSGFLAGFVFSEPIESP